MDNLEELTENIGKKLFDLMCLGEIAFDLSNDRNLGCLIEIMNNEIEIAFEDIEKCRQIISFK